MKVILCIYELLNGVGGAERSLIDLANELSSRGHEILILNNQFVDNGNQKHFYPIRKDVKIISFHQKSQTKVIENKTIKKTYPNSLSIDHLHGRLSNWIGKKAINHFLNKAFNYLFYCAKIEKEILEEQNLNPNNQITEWLNRNEQEISLWREQFSSNKAQVVVSFMVRTYTYVSQAMVGLNIPHIIVNRTDPSKSPHYYNEEIFKKLIYYAVEMSFCNVVLHESYIGYFDQKHQTKTRVIPNPIAKPNKFEQAYFDKTEKVILNVGRLIQSKNHELLIRAFHLIHHKYPNWKVKIYGIDVSYKEHLIHLVETLGLVNKVEFFEPVMNIEKVYQTSDIFAFPSLYEGFPRALGEAISHCLPCLVIEDCTVNKELVKNGNFGLVAKNTAEDYAEKLENLMSNKNLREQLGFNCIDFAKLYSPVKVYDKWEDLLKMTTTSKNHFFTQHSK